MSAIKHGNISEQMAQGGYQLSICSPQTLSKNHAVHAKNSRVKNDYADIQFFDEITKQSLDESFLQLIQHPSFHFNMNACCDYTQAYSGLTMQEIEEHAQFVGQNLHKRGGSYKLALISNDTLNNALLSVYKLLISKTSVEAEVFTNKRQGLSWLLSSD